MEDCLDLEQIKALLPHRPPFLFLDKVEELQAGESAVGYRYIDKNEPVFQGHFPNNPILPGVLIIEALAQTAGVVVASMAPDKKLGVLFRSVEKTKFKKPVFPGNTLKLVVCKQNAIGKLFKFSGKAFVDDCLVCESSFSALASLE